MKQKLRPLTQLLVLVVFLFGSYSSFGQGRISIDKKKEKREIPQAALDHIKKARQKFRLSEKEITNLELSSETESTHNGLKHVYLKQTHEGIEIHGALTNINMNREGKVLSMGDRFLSDVERKVNTTKPGIDASEAVAAAAKHLNTSVKESLSVIEKGDTKKQEVVFNNAGISLEPIYVKLVYQPVAEGSLRLAWEVSIYELDAQNWWIVRVDAMTGEFLDKDNMVAHCEFDNNGPTGEFLHANHSHTASVPTVQEPAVVPYAVQESVVSVASRGKAPGLYEVYRLPVESPSHGRRTLVNERAAQDKVASPDGWHKVGSTNYTITKGNNVYAYEDPDNTGYVGGPEDFYGYSPDGGNQRIFRFPLNFDQEPVAYKDAAITNLFYWNNMVHDVWYNYGFDEASGNFQTVNFGRGGEGGDHVMAEAQDSRNIPATRNNANFATLPDGVRPRMQMYLWSGKPDPNAFTIVSPSSIAGGYIAANASFGPELTATPLAGKLVLAEDGLNNEGCNPFTNADAINGNIALVYRGSCNFTQKVENAQAAGAIAVVVINSQPGDPTSMGGTPTQEITIPSVMISNSLGGSIVEQLNQGVEVLVELKNEGGPELDGDFDNGIIVHEYGHGISNRLTGGPDNTSCLPTQVRAGNQILTTEQMGEGWSDWFALMMTMRAEDTREKIRGIGTYAQGQPTTGLGIRPAPYSTDFSVNSYTYAATNDPNLSAPHGIGFVFATALWEMTWDLIDKYGFDDDLYHGTGGNNIAMQLVIDGLKLQPCYPGFVDGRDAILEADRINYGGANQELIWRAFARRGVGYSADQGLSYYRFDQVEAYDLPEIYSTTTATAASDFSVRAVPNPFGSKTQIEFTIAEEGTYRLEILDKDGILVTVLAQGVSKAGQSHKAEFNRGNLAGGLYVARVVTDKQSKITRIVLE